MTDPTPPPVPTEALECPQCKITPHDEPDKPHIHLTDFGYVLFTPNHELRDYIEEIREFERAAGRTAAAADIRQKINDWRPGPNTSLVALDVLSLAARIAEGEDR